MSEESRELERQEAGQDPLDKLVESWAKREQEALDAENEDKKDESEEENKGGDDTDGKKEETVAGNENEDGDSKPAEQNEKELTQEEKLQIFNELADLNFENPEQIQQYKDIVDKWDKHKSTIELYPELIEKLKTTQDVMQYFPDEATFKVAQLAKEEDYKGKEDVLMRILKSDIPKMSDMEVVNLYAGFSSPSGVRNPLRYAIRKMGLDPDIVLESFDDLDDDEKDLFYGFATQARKDLSKIGNDIEVPKSSVDDIEAILKQQADSAKDDLEKRRVQVFPVSTAIVDDIKELKLDDDFSFKLSLSGEEKQDYSEFLTDAVLSGDFDVSTDEGKQGLYAALMDEIWIDNRDKILKAYRNELRTKLEAEFREKYNNEVPLNKKTPEPKDEDGKVSSMTNLVRGMIQEYD